MDFVRASQGRLLEGERPFRFVLVNAYYLQEEAARGRLDLVDETLAACAAIGVAVVRAWAFNDDPNKADTGIQRERLRYSAVGLAGLDRVIERARAHGLRLILPLSSPTRACAITTRSMWARSCAATTRSRACSTATIRPCSRGS